MVGVAALAPARSACVCVLLLELTKFLPLSLVDGDGGSVCSPSVVSSLGLSGDSVQGSRSVVEGLGCAVEQLGCLSFLFGSLSLGLLLDRTVLDRGERLELVRVDSVLVIVCAVAQLVSSLDLAGSRQVLKLGALASPGAVRLVEVVVGLRVFRGSVGRNGKTRNAGCNCDCTCESSGANTVLEHVGCSPMNRKRTNVDPDSRFGRVFVLRT